MEAVRSATRCTSEQVVSAAWATACVLAVASVHGKSSWHVVYSCSGRPACEWNPPLCGGFREQLDPVAMLADAVTLPKPYYYYCYCYCYQYHSSSHCLLLLLLLLLFLFLFLGTALEVLSCAREVPKRVPSPALGSILSSRMQTVTGYSTSWLGR